MDIALIALVTVLVASLTFVSGFGLGTLLLPVFILFFPVDIAVACTAVVHLANNIFKAFLIGKKADLRVVFKFSFPAVLFSVLGALLLHRASGGAAIFHYQLAHHVFWVTPVKLLVALIMAAFSVLEFLPAVRHWAFPPQWIWAGGASSGFFGGLTGHQGALRAAFLVRLGLDKETFIGTTVLSSILIDIARLSVYGATFFTKDFQVLFLQGKAGLLATGVAAAFLGAVAGYFLMQKVTLERIHQVIGVLLIVYSLGLAGGLI